MNDNNGMEIPGDVLSFVDENEASNWMEKDDVIYGNYLVVFDDGFVGEVFISNGSVGIKKSSKSRIDLLNTYMKIATAMPRK